MNPPPQSHAAKTCPACGADIPKGATYCLQCGRAVAVNPGRIIMVIFAILLTIFIALPAFLMGACALVMAVGSPSPVNFVYALAGLAVGGMIIMFLVYAIRSLHD